MTHWGSSPSYLVLLVMMIGMVMETLLAMTMMMRMAALDALSPIIFCPRPVFGTLAPPLWECLNLIIVMAMLVLMMMIWDD